MTAACREVCYKRKKIIYGFHSTGLHSDIYVKSKDVNCIYNWHNEILQVIKREGKVKEFHNLTTVLLYVKKSSLLKINYLLNCSCSGTQTHRIVHRYSLVLILDCIIIIEIK